MIRVQGWSAPGMGEHPVWDQSGICDCIHTARFCHSLVSSWSVKMAPKFGGQVLSKFEKAQSEFMFAHVMHTWRDSRVKARLQMVRPFPGLLFREQTVWNMHFAATGRSGALKNTTLTGNIHRDSRDAFEALRSLPPRPDRLSRTSYNPKPKEGRARANVMKPNTWAHRSKVLPACADKIKDVNTFIKNR